jgi:amino acid adenylation domain-containing protein
MPDGLSSDITGLSADALAELDRLLAAEGIGAESTSIVTPRDPAAPALASFSQELLWMLDRGSPGMTAYNLPVARRLRGPLDVPALERALSILVARHESLRTRFADGEGVPVQVIDPPASVAVRLADLSSLPADEREREAERVVGARARTPIDLAHEPAFRVTLVRLATDDHVLLIETHHIVVDGWSMGIIFRELSEAYAAARAGREAALPPLPIQFADFATWQRTRLAGERLNELLAFWRAQLGTAADEPLSLPTDFPRPTTPSFAGARQSVVLSGSLLAAVRRLAQANDATLYMTLLAAYATVLHRYTGRTDVLIGSGSAGRTLPETQGVVGYLNSTLVQRGDFSGDPSFGQLLGRVRASAIGAYDHQDMPLEKLVLTLRDGKERLSHAPLFEVVLTMQETLGTSMSLAGLTVEPFGIDFGATKFDITLLVSERADEVALTAQYRTDLFAPETMRRFLGHVLQVLESAAANPAARVSELALLTPAERAELAKWNDTAAEPGAPATLVELFQRQAARVPDRVAVVAPSSTPQAGVTASTTLTYRELNARANQLARYLIASGARSGTPVGLLLDRSADAIVGLLGILKTGGAYVPLSVDAPSARLAQQLAECGAQLVITSASMAHRLPSSATIVPLDSDAVALGAHDGSDLPLAASPRDAAYVLFTSGSTGVPKGVEVTHGNIVHYTRAIRRVLGAEGDEPTSGRARQYGMASTFAADLGNTCLFPALLGGATLHLLGPAVATDPERFAQYMAAQQLDVLKITPNHLKALVAGKADSELGAVLPRQTLVLGGEALDVPLARTLLAANACRVINHYGPTETTVGVLTHAVTTESLDHACRLGAQTVPLGRPLSDTGAYVVDARGREQLPVGVPGELWIGGAGVAAGYVNRPELTAERFTSFAGDRVYRTGDRVRRLADGTIEFLGRADDQVKVRGYRVEPGEVEQSLRAHPAVAQCAVILRRDEGTEPRLVAYVVAKQAGYAMSHGERSIGERLTEWLGGRLPEYMTPSAVVLLDALPLTANGKVDRAALPAPEAVNDPSATAHVEPRTETESKLAAIWGEVLKRDLIGATDNFLALGGHSLLAIRVLGRISKTFGVRLPLRALFDAPTVEALAKCIEAEQTPAAAAPEPGLVSRSREAYRVGRSTTPGAGSAGGTGKP